MAKVRCENFQVGIYQKWWRSGKCCIVIACLGIISSSSTLDAIAPLSMSFALWSIFRHTNCKILIEVWEWYESMMKNNDFRRLWWNYTVWKYYDFSITRILREIKFGSSRSAQSHVEALKIFYEFLNFLKAEN